MDAQRSGGLVVCELQVETGLDRLSTDSQLEQNAMDFTNNPEEFPVLLATVKRQWGYASEKLLDLIAHWQELSEKYFANLVEVSLVADEQRIDGKVLGKAFTLKLGHITIGKSGYTEAVLLLNQEDGGKFELDRFHVDQNGMILAPGGETLLDTNDRHYSYKIFTSILRVVIEAPLVVKS